MSKSTRQMLAALYVFAGILQGPVHADITTSASEEGLLREKLMGSDAGRGLARHPRFVCGPLAAPISTMSIIEDVQVDGVLLSEDDSAECSGLVELDLGAPMNSDGFPQFLLVGTLDCCCPGPESLFREINLNSNLNDILENVPNLSPFSRVKISLTSEPCNLECCDSCKCWGDPRCKSFLANDVAKLAAPEEPLKRVRSTFLTCDNRLRYADGTCSAKDAISTAARNRCNAIDGCTYRGFDDDYDFNEIGAPCQPDGSVDFNMVFYEDTSILVTQKLGERGIIASVKIEFKGQVGSNSAVEINAKKDCFHPMNVAGSTVQSMLSGAAFSTPLDAPPEEMREVFTFNNIQFDRKLNVKADGQTGDVIWTLSTLGTGLTFFLNCAGATLPPGSPLMAGGQTAVATSSTPGIVTSEGGISTRSDVITRMDTAVFYDRGFDNGNVGGFCQTGEFRTDQGVQVASQNSGNSLDLCPDEEKLRKADWKFLKSLDICQEVLDENNCGGFTFHTRRRRFDKANYRTLMELCAEAVCEAAFESNESEYGPPPGSDIEECPSEMRDFGAFETFELYFNTFKKQTTSTAQECNTYELVYVIEGPTSDAGDDLEFILATGALNNFAGLEMEIDIQEGAGLPDDITGRFGHPKRIALRTFECAETCGTVPKIVISAQYLTQCQEALEFIRWGATMANTMKIGEKEMNIEKYINLIPTS